MTVSPHPAEDSEESRARVESAKRVSWPSCRALGKREEEGGMGEKEPGLNASYGENRKKKKFKQQQIGRGKQMELGEELDVGWR